jgi:Domain of Unknown Function (DUF1206)
MRSTKSKAGSIGSIKADVKRAGQKAAFSPLMEELTRLGYGVRGLIYITMGLLAFNVMFGKGGAPTDQQGAIAAIDRQPASMRRSRPCCISLMASDLWASSQWS